MRQTMEQAYNYETKKRYEKMDKRTKDAKDLKKWLEDDDQQDMVERDRLEALDMYDETPHAFVAGPHGLIYNHNY